MRTGMNEYTQLWHKYSKMKAVRTELQEQYGQYMLGFTLIALSVYENVTQGMIRKYWINHNVLSLDEEMTLA